MVKLLSTVFSIANPLAVIVNFSTVDRNVYFHEDNIYHTGPWNMPDNITKATKRFPTNSDYKIDLSKHYISNFFNPTNAMMQTYEHARTVRALCKDRTKLLTISGFGDSAHAARVDMFFNRMDNGARDCMHPGPEFNIDIANWINEQL